MEDELRMIESMDDMTAAAMADRAAKYQQYSEMLMIYKLSATY